MKIKYLLYISAFIVSTVLLMSCEKVVELDLEDAEQMVVIEGIVHDSLGDNFVKLTKSKSFNDNSGGFEAVSGASVVISDNFGNTFTLLETEPGYYKSDSLCGISGRTYQLNVNANGKQFSSASFMYPKVNLDSLSHEKFIMPKSNPNDPTIYRLRTYFFDMPNIKNYYRIKAFNKGVQAKGFIVMNDDLLNGGIAVIPVFRTDFYEGDTAVIQLLTIDEANYRYFNAISSSQNGEVPGNPETNIIGDNVVGYFGAYAKSERKLIIAPLP